MSITYDQIKKYELISGPETVNGEWSSKSQQLDDRFGAFSVFVKYENGVSVDMSIAIQLSNNNEDWATVDETIVPVTDDSGTVLYDINGSGTQYLRVLITVNGGSIDVVQIRLTAGQFH